MNKGKLVVKLLANPKARGFAIKLLKNPRIRSLIVKQVLRQLRRRIG